MTGYFCPSLNIISSSKAIGRDVKLPVLHMPQSEQMMIERVNYIHNNPVKRGYVDEPIHWRYSSARNYADQEGLIEIERLW